MKKFFHLFCAGVLVSALCVGFVGCNDSRTNGPDDTRSTEEGSKTGLSDAYYWLGDEKIPLERIDGKYFVMFLSENEAKFKAELAKVGVAPTNVKEYNNSQYAYIKRFDAANMLAGLKTATVEGDYEKVKNALSLTFYWGPYYRNEMSPNIWPDNKFSVKLKSDADYPLLEKMAEENGVEIIEYDEFIDVYRLACTNDSKGKSVEMGNFFHEAGLFEWACAGMTGVGRID